MPTHTTPHTPHTTHHNSELPTPTDERVSLREVPERVYLVRQFSGNMGKDGVYESAAERERAVTEKAVKAGDGAFLKYVGPGSKYLVARCVDGKQTKNYGKYLFDVTSNLEEIMI